MSYDYIYLFTYKWTDFINGMQSMLSDFQKFGDNAIASYIKKIISHFKVEITKQGKLQKKQNKIT